MLRTREAKPWERFLPPCLSSSSPLPHSATSPALTHWCLSLPPCPPSQIGQPFDTIKVRLQVLGQGTALAAKLPPSEVYKDSMDCVRKMIKSEGPLSFYKGTVAPLVGNMVLLGIHFPVFSSVRKMLEGDDHYSNFSHANVLLSGAAAGAAGSLISAPVELVRTKMQMQVRAWAWLGFAGSLTGFRVLLLLCGLLER